MSRTIHSNLKQVFSIDLRSMALMRILLALLILFDLVLRVPTMRLFYTDHGVLPRDRWLQINNDWHLSLHAASGELWWQITLFILAALAAIGLLLGYRTRLMNIISWLLLMSLCNRNELVLQGGDILLMVMCFWGIFLPLGARWSIDAAMQPEYIRNPNHRRFEPDREQLYFSMATIAIIIQILLLYIFTAVLKTGAPWRPPFEAAQYSLEIQHFTTPIGQWFKGLTPVLPAATFYVIAVEFVAPLLVLLPFLWPTMRIVGLVLLASLHIAFLFLLHLGLFPLIDFMALSLLIPSALWIALAKRNREQKSSKIILYYDQDCGFCLKMCLILRECLLPDTVKILPAQHYDDIFALMDKENTWVITDADENTYTHWQAMAFVFNQCWPTKPIAWLMKFPPFMALGNRLYRWVGNNRPTMSKLTARALVPKPIKLKPALAPQLLAFFLLVIVLLYNVSTLPDMGKLRVSVVDISARVFRIDQRWSMFAPRPLVISVFPQVEGRLRNGQSVNLYERTETQADWVAPEYMYPLYDGYRVRKYFDRLRTHRNNATRSAFGHYQCRTWNTQARQRNEQLGILSLHFVSLRTNLEDLPKERIRKLSWQHWCYPEFKPRT